MPVKMRLRRMGAKHQPSYRIVIADSRSPRDGRYIDQVGFYNPLTNPATITMDKDKAVDWLRRGAQPSDTVAILLQKMDINPGLARGGKKGATPNPLRPRADAAPAASTAPVAGAPEALTQTPPPPVESEAAAPAEEAEAGVTSE